MASKATFLIILATSLLLISQMDIISQVSASTVAAYPPPPPPTGSSVSQGPAPLKKDCVPQCWDICNCPVRARNMRPCMKLCTSCCAKCNNYAYPKCKSWSTVTIEGHTYDCPKRQKANGTKSNPQCKKKF